MSATAPAPAPAPVDSGTAAAAETPRLRTTARTWGYWVAAGVLALLVAIVVTVTSGSPAPGDPYSITNAGPAGSKALAEVLRQQGVDVIEAGSLDEARAAAGGTDATVVFTDPYGLLPDASLADVAGIGTDLVLVEPLPAELDALAPGILSAGVPGDDSTLSASCTLPAAERAGSISSPAVTYRAASTDAAALGCFPAGDDSYGLLAQPSAHGDGSVSVLGAGDALTNATIADNGNAALALGLLGAHPTLVWYIPTAADVAGGTAPTTIGELTPGWVTPVILLLILVTVAAGIWRGRRFGALVVENLPVTVRASETMEGRARLYARQGARSRAIDALRIGTIGRIAGALGLPRFAPVEEVVLAVAAATGRPAAEVRDTLVGVIPQSDGELRALSDHLLVLEQQVRRAAGG